MKNYPLAILAFLCYISCHRPDQSGPMDNWCTSGINILTVDDSNVPGPIKTQIYSPPGYYTAVGNADYNATLPFVIIPYRFPVDWPFNTSVTTTSIRRDFFETGIGSVKDYFHENSWGQYNIREGYIATVTTVPRDTLFYAEGQEGRDWSRNATLARDICQNSHVDWAAIDVNGDRIISRREAQICFLHATGFGGGCRPANITIKTNTGNYTINADFVFIACKRDDDPTKGGNDIAINYPSIFHELCHGMFRLPDRYTEGTCANGRTGAYDIMCDNCTEKHLSIYDKMKIGWVRPRILVKASQRSDRARHCYTFPASEATPAALILWDQNQPNEYWIVENRNRQGSPRNFDNGLPESGLAIWWVNEDTDELSLVDARDANKRPQTILYEAGTAQTGALFKNRGTRDSSYNMQYLRSSVNFADIAVRAPSPPALNMYAEF